MKIEILGMGCPKCTKLYANTMLAVKELGLTTVEVTKIEDFRKIRAYGVLSTPALVINGQMKSTGRLLNIAEIKKLLA